MKTSPPLSMPSFLPLNEFLDIFPTAPQSPLLRPLQMPLARLSAMKIELIFYFVKQKQVTQRQIRAVRRVTQKFNRCAVQEVPRFERRMRGRIVTVSSSPRSPLFGILLLTVVNTFDKHLVVYHSVLTLL